VVEENDIAKWLHLQLTDLGVTPGAAPDQEAPPR
jgi:hypothetical protein